MEEEKRIKLYRMAANKWGERAQLEMIQEEATELALAVRKFIRNQDKKSLDAVASEIADVEIMIEQIKNLYPGIEAFAEMERDRKLNRLQTRIETNKFN